MSKPISFSLASELETCAWFNTAEALSLYKLRGKVIVISAFQMLCPSCVSHSLPQANTLQALHPRSQLQIIGLHTVFEHHHVMTVDALQVFIHEYKLKFAIAADQPSSNNDIPVTMRKLELKGTPSIVLIDKQGRIRLNHFGHLHDLQLGSLVGRLLTE